MSAITGIFYRDGRKVDPELIKKMNNRLSHRGPDGSAVWCEGSIALGHQMLWTTPESLHEKLPFEDNESGLVITADARIDNRDELSKELDIEDKEEVSDSYFILKAYEKWGENCPDKLLGDFAFAIWDKNEEKLFCARDHMGVKPFYYYLDEDMFVFGTEIKALFCVPGVPRELNEKKVALYLMHDVLDKKMTFYENINGLMPAYFIILHKYEVKNRNYWILDPNYEVTMGSDEEYAKAFIEIFTEAVKCRLRSYFPIGFGLSGGLDSSSIVCIAKKIYCEKTKNFEKINTFSFIFDEIIESDERDYINELLKMDIIDSCFIKSDNISPLNEINDILWHQDQPFYTPNMAIHNKLYHEVHKKSIRVFLMGEGGDEVVSYGQNYIRELAVTFQWKKLVKEINGYARNVQINKYKLLFGKIIFPNLPNCLKKHVRLHLKRYKNIIIDKIFLKTLGITYENEINHINKIEQFTSKEFHYYVLNGLSHHNVAFEPVDKICEAYSIESRYPFFDKRLIEFCYAIPTEIKLRYGWDRYILRIAMENILPKKIQWRPKKTDLAPVYRRNLLLFEKNILEKLLNNNENIKGYINLNKLEIALKNYLFNGKNEGTPNLWLITLLNLWLDQLKRF